MPNRTLTPAAGGQTRRGSLIHGLAVGQVGRHEMIEALRDAPSTPTVRLPVHLRVGEFMQQLTDLLVVRIEVAAHSRKIFGKCRVCHQISWTRTAHAGCAGRRPSRAEVAREP